MTRPRTRASCSRGFRLQAELLLAAALVAVTAQGASARTWTVGAAGADFPLISPALAAAIDGDTIEVGPGVYRENLVLTRAVRIVGKGSPVLFGTGIGSVIRILAPGSEISGLTIEGSGTGETNEMDAAIQVASSGNRIVGNTMRRVFYGVVIAGGSENEVSANDITGFEDLPFGRRGDGIYVYRAAHARVLRNRIAGERDGIYFQYAPGGVADGNVVASSRYGLHVMFANDIAVRGNTLRESSVGANIMDSRRIEVTGNRFERNRGVSAVGLTLKQCDDSTIRDNVLVDNARGVQVDAASRNRFVGNRFQYNDTGLVLFSSAERNVFSANVFDGNWSDVVITGRGAATSWSESGRGNQWSGYTGFDFDSDGIGDTPHPLLTPFAAIEGANPIARLFLQTPAAAGLALAARAGLSPVGGERDRHPLAAVTANQGAAVEDKAHHGAALILAALTIGLLLAVAREVSPC
jgi:nitrous oxidase accessory protein